MDTYLDLASLVVGQTYVINLRNFGFKPSGMKAGERVTLVGVTPRASSSGFYATVRTDGGSTNAMIGYEWLDHPTNPQQEAIMTTHKIGDRVVVTDARTSVGSHPLGSGGSSFVGGTATVVSVTDFGDYSLKFDDDDLGSAGTWSHAALDLIVETPTAERPLVHFDDIMAGRDRSKARAYATEAVSRTLDDEHNAILVLAAEGKSVDAYALNAAITAAMRSAVTRLAQSMARRKMAEHFAHLGHIVQATLENHATSVGDPNADNLRGLTEERDVARARVNDLCEERATLKQAASDERRRLCAEIDENHAQAVAEGAELRATIDALREDLADTTRARVIADNALDYTLRSLVAPDNFPARLEGFKDGVAVEYDYRQD